MVLGFGKGKKKRRIFGIRKVGTSRKQKLDRLERNFLAEIDVLKKQIETKERIIEKHSSTITTLKEKWLCATRQRDRYRDIIMSLELGLDERLDEATRTKIKLLEERLKKREAEPTT